jgi:transcriptional regulator with XRE-family HTH domain
MSVKLENGSEQRKEVTSGAEINRKVPGEGHHLAEVRNRQGLSQRCVANRLGISVAEVRKQEEPSFDLTLSQLYRWQAALDVPIRELIHELEDTLLPDVVGRARMLRVMKTAHTVRLHARAGEQQRLAKLLVDQLIDTMPELQGVSSWPSVGQRRLTEEFGRIVENPISEEWLYSSNSVG